MITIPQAAQQAGISARRLRAHIAAGSLTAHKTGRDWLITPAELRRFLDTPRRAGRPVRTGTHCAGCGIDLGPAQNGGSDAGTVAVCEDCHGRITAALAARGGH